MSLSRLVLRRLHVDKMHTQHFVTSDSGRRYDKIEILRRHPHNESSHIYKAKSGERSFVYKRVPPRFYERSQQLAKDLASSTRLRNHIDSIANESILIYKYYRETLLALLENDPSFCPVERGKIMYEIAEAVQELHAADWVHADIKPDNILIDWTHDEDGKKIVTAVTLGDFDIACKLRDNESRLTPHAVGNAMWRSPQAQTGLASKAADVYSLGLVYIFLFGAGEMLVLNDYQDLLKAGITPEQEIVTRHFSYFGPVPDALYRSITDDKWKSALQSASLLADAEVEARPELRMSVWAQDVGKNGLDLLHGMTNLDPGARWTISQVLRHPFWKEALE